jgi:hypothetical protein
MGQALLKRRASDGPLHLAGTLKLDTWNGQERVELHIQDAALPVAEAGVERLVS